MILTEKFEVHDTLNPKLWTADNQLRDDVREKLLEIIEQFISTCDVPINMVDAHLVGSNASYNYTQYSDLDVHVISNFDLIDAPKEIVQFVYNSVKAKFNSDYDVSIHGVDVELYVEDIRSTAISNGVYSMAQRKWLKFPQKLTDIPQVSIDDIYPEWKERFERAIKSNNSEQITNVINDIYMLRKNSLDSEGEYGKGNLVFKEIRNAGLLDAAKDAYKEIRSKELTLEKLQLTEASRSDLISKSKQTDKGFERFKKRVKSRVANSVKQYNSIDMNKLFKDDILTVDVQVQGETDKYIVKISFGGFLDLLHKELERQNGTLDLKAVNRALVNGMNRSDVYISCTCPDSAYRFSYHQTRTGVKSGEEENRPSNITNPHDNLGSACKHTLLVLSNISWMIRVASTIFNYINYMEKHYQKLYADVIYPAIYQKKYEEPVQLDILTQDSDNLETDVDTIDTSNKYAVDKTRFKQGNTQGIRFTSSNNDKQMSILDDEPAANLAASSNH